MIKTNKYKIEKYKQIDSTQTRLREIFGQRPEHVLVIAESQKTGYGMRGSRWISPENGLYMSLLLKTSGFNGLMSINVLVSVLESLKEQGIDIFWKWPNDIVDVNSKKVGGILTEHLGKGWYAIGVGLNTFAEIPENFKHSASVMRGLKKDSFISSFILKIEKHKNNTKITPGLLAELNSRMIYKGSLVNINGKIAELDSVNSDATLKLLRNNRKSSVSSGNIVKVDYKQMPENNLLLIDMGNTTTKIALMKAKLNVKLKSINTKPYKTFGKRLDSALAELKASRTYFPEYAGLSSVVDELTDTCIKSVKKVFKLSVLTVTSKSRTGIDIKIKRPSTLGADRICNAVAAYHIYGGYNVVLDFGTANTFDVVALNCYAGGIIAPGAGVMLKSLLESTSKLKKKNFSKPDKLIGDDTASAIKSGIFYTVGGQIETTIDALKKALPYDFNLILAGGDSMIFKSFYRGKFVEDPLLTLKGIALIIKQELIDNK